MKKLVMAVTAALVFSMSAMAQDGQRPQRNFDQAEMVKNRTEQVVSKYGLNEQQAQQLLELNKKYADKMMPARGFRSDGRGGRARMRPNRPDSLQRPQRPERPEGNDSIGRERRPRMQGGRQGQGDMRQTMEAYNAELKGIMTEEQFKAYQADQQNRMRQRGRSPRN